MVVGWKAENRHNRLKCQLIQIGPAWEAEKMAVYTELKACCLDIKSWS